MPGFTLKLLVNGGGYSYFSGGLNANVDGTMLGAAVLPGWHVTRDGLTVSMFAGPTVQDYRLSPYDPGSSLHGFYVGAQLAVDLWYQPSPGFVAAVNAMAGSTGPTESLRTALGWRVFDSFFAGPETQGIWCADYRQLRLGVHVTGFRFNAAEWSAAGGYATDSDRRPGAYFRLGINTRY